MEREETAGVTPGGETAGSPQSDGYLALARRLALQGFELGRLRPPHELSASTRGLPAVMGALAAATGPLSPGELARKTGVTDARIANALRRLEEKGLVERRPSSVDRRRVEVLLTPEGRAFIREHTQEADLFVAAFLRELGPDDARDLVRLLDRVIEVLRARKERGAMATPPHSATPFRASGPGREDRDRGEVRP